MNLLIVDGRVLQILLQLFGRLVVKVLDLVDLLVVENVLVAHLLQELEEEGALSFGSSLGDFFIKIRIQVCLLKHILYYVRAVGTATIVLLVNLSMALEKLGILDSLLSETELKHFDALDQVLVDVLLRCQLTLQLTDTLLHLRLLEQPLSLVRVLLPVHVFERVEDLVQRYVALGATHG